MKKSKLFIITLILLTLIPSSVLAASNRCSGTSVDNLSLCNPLGTKSGNIDTFEGFVLHVLQIFAATAGIVAIVFVVFSGFRFITSQGNEEAVTSAKRSLTYSILGFILIMISYVVVKAIDSFLTYKGVKQVDPTKPQLTNPLGKINTFSDVYRTFIDGFFEVMGLIAILIIIINGYRYITSAGNTEQAEKAKQGITYAVLGVIIALLGFVIVHATSALLTGK